jgi:hypothetical protein
MAERQAISKRMRFEIFKRDSFTCQYCGKQSPDVVLHVDHIMPVSKGGKNTLINLITSCIDCNQGKSDKELSDDSAVKKQQKHLSELAERKAQIQMMVQWRESLLSADEEMTESAVALINKYMREWSLTDSGIDRVRKAIKKKGYQSVIDAIETCYTRSSSNADFKEKYTNAIEFAGVVSKRTLSYAKGILKNRGVRISDKSFYSEFPTSGFSEKQINHLIEAAKSCSSIDDFRAVYAEVINGKI